MVKRVSELLTTTTTPAKAMTMPVQPSAGRRRPPNQARIAEKAVVVVMTIEPTDGGVRAIASPQEAWNNATPISDSRIIGSQSRRDRAMGLRISAATANRKRPATR